MTTPVYRRSVLMVAPGPFFVDRGFGVAVYEQSRALSKRGIRVEVVCYSSGRDLPDVRIHRAWRFPGYDATKIGPSLIRLPHWLLLLLRTFLVAKRTRPNVLHGHLHEGALICAFVSRLLGIPWVFDVQGSMSKEMAEKSPLREGSLAFRTISRFERGIDKLAPLLLVKSNAMQQELVDRFGVDATRIRCVMDGADPDVFAPREADVALRAELGIDASAVVVGYLGLLNKQQGIDRVLNAAPAVLARHPDCHFLVMGFPVEDAQKLADDLGIRDHVTFTGALDYQRAPAHLALVDLAVAPKLSETEGNGKLYNYMSMALPVVAMDIPSNRQLLGDDAYYVEHDSPQAFADGIDLAIRSRVEWPERGRLLRTRIQQDLSWDAVASRIVAAYTEVAPDAFGETARV